MTRSLVALGVLGAFSVALSAAPVPVVPPDPLPKGATARLGTPYFRGPHATGLTFSSDGKKLIAFDSSRSIRDFKQSLSLWDADTGKKLPSKFVPPAGLDRFPSTGSALAGDRVVGLHQERPGANNPSELVLTDLDGKVLNRIELPAQALFFTPALGNDFANGAVSGDSRYGAVTLDGGRAVAVYDLDSGRRLLNERFEKTDQPAVCFTQDRTTLFVRQNGKPIRRFELPAGKELPPLEGTGRETRRVATSPDGKRVATLKSYSSKVVDGKARTEYPKALDLYDGETGKRVGELEVGPVGDVVFADDESVLVFGVDLRPLLPPVVTYAKWSVTTRKRVWEVPATGYGLTVSPDGKRFVSIDSAQLFLHDTADGKLLIDSGGHSSFVTWVGFSPDGSTVTTVGGAEVMTWALDGRRKTRTSVPELQDVKLHFYTVAMSNHLTWRAYSRDPNPKLYVFGWDHKQNVIGWKIPVEQQGTAITPDGRHLVGVRGDPAQARNLVTIHDVTTGNSLREWSYQLPKGMGLFCGDGRFFVLAEEGSIKLRDALTGEEVATVKHSFDKPPTGPDWIPGLDASADGEKLAVIEKGKISVYQPKSGKLLARLAFQDETPRRLKFSSDGKRLALWHTPGSGDMFCVLIWDLDSPAAKPRRLEADSWSSATCAAFSPDGTKLAVGYADGTALVWDLTVK